NCRLGICDGLPNHRTLLDQDQSRWRNAMGVDASIPKAHTDLFALQPRGLEGGDGKRGTRLLRLEVQATGNNPNPPCHCAYAQTYIYDGVEIIATANDGAVQVVQPLRLVYHPALMVKDHVIVGKPVDVRGADFRPGVDLSLGIRFPDRTYRWIKEVSADAQGVI